MVTVSDPDVDVCDVQSAEQEEALDEDQVNVDAVSYTHLTLPTKA